MARLTWDDVHKIRQLLAEGLTCTEIARQFPVTRTSIGRIKKGISWAEQRPSKGEPYAPTFIEEGEAA